MVKAKKAIKYNQRIIIKMIKTIGLSLWNIIVTIAHAVLTVLYKIIGKELTDEAFDGWIQFVKFGMVGVLNTVLSYLITEGGYFALRKPLGSETLALQISQTAAFIITVFISYLINSTLVFKKEEGKERNPWKTLIKTYIAYSFTGILLNNVLIYIEVELLHFSPLIAPLLNLIIDVPVNFFMNKLWAYRTE